MAKSAKGAGNFLVPLVVVAVVIVGALALTFWSSSEEPPDQPTIIAEDDVEARPAGAGTVPEPPVDEEIEGIDDQIDEVEPIAPGEDSVPAAEEDATSAGGQAQEDTSDADGGNGAQEDAAEDGASNGGGFEDAARLVPEDDASTSGSDDARNGESFLGDESSDAPEGAEVDTIEDRRDEDLPAGRDTQIELTPDPDQDVVEDTDDGGAAFIPTPSGPSETR